MYKLILVVFSHCLFNTAIAQNVENGVFISSKGGIIPKYAILTIENDSAQLEVFTRWQGVWLPAVGAWDNSYQPQKLIRSENGSLTNENVIVQNKSSLIGLVKNSFVGRMKFKFTKVDALPEKFTEVRQESTEFIGRKG